MNRPGWLLTGLWRIVTAPFTRRKRMSEALDRLTKEVAETKTVNASVRALLGSLATRLRNALSSGDTAALNALAGELDAEQASMAAAVTANTVAEDEPAPTPAPEPGTGGGEV